VGLSLAPSAGAFAAGWALLSVPISLRGVRAVYFAKRVPAAELSRVGQLASAAGLVGALAGTNIYIYIYVHMRVYMYICIYIYTAAELSRVGQLASAAGLVGALAGTTCIYIYV